ncbi:hypothetical protein [Azospirillum sp. Marseille-Q6669]
MTVAIPMTSPAASAVPREAQETPAMIDMTLYDPATGRIAGVATCMNVMLDLAYPDYAKHLGEKLDGRTLYIDPVTKEVCRRPQISLVVDKTRIAADGADSATITGLRTGTMLYLNGRKTVVNDSEIIFSTPHPGLHRLNFESFPYQDIEVVIHAT